MFLDALRHARPSRSARPPPSSTPPPSRWRRSAESRGALMAVVCEHHTMADGYLPSPLVLATAMAARTTTLPIMTAALILPLYDPIRLAEDMAVLDIISGGRVSYVLAVGYRPEEYEHHGVDFRPPRPARRRAARPAAAGQDRRAVRARGPPHPRHARRRSPPADPGSSGAAAARRRPSGPAGSASTSSPRAAAPSSRRPTPRRRAPTATSPASAWSRPPTWPPRSSSPTTSTPRGTSSGRTCCTTSSATPRINEGNTHTASLSTATTVEELRAEDRTHRIVTVDEAVDMVKRRHAAAAATARRRPAAGDRLALPPHRHRRGRAAAVSATAAEGHDHERWQSRE